MKSLILRSITGALFVALLVGGIVCGSVCFNLLFTLVVILATWEFSTIVNEHAGASVNRVINSLAAGCFYWGAAMEMNPFVEDAYLPYVIALLFLLISELYLEKPNPLKNWAYALASHIYIAVPFILLHSIAMQVGIHPYDGVLYNWHLPLCIFIFLWTSDTGAYLCGSTLSRYFPAKLFPRISPKKSWVGSIGGGLLCILVALLLEHLMQTHLSALEMVGLSLVVCVFGTWGDLFESLLKRQVGIKDSGKMLPGHGGMLDRFDSSLLAIPAAYIYLQLIF